MIGALFAGKLDRALPLLDPQAIADLDDDSDARLAALVKQAGRLQKVTPRTQRACGNLAGPAFCFEYALRTSRDVVTATFELWLKVGRWQVRTFTLEPTRH